MPVNSSVLTHFTNDIANIGNILTNNFIPKLCKENYQYLLRKEYNILIPMVCFCDIPLHLLHEHIHYYGFYGIGLSKSWGRKNGLNPVIYLEEKSMLTDSFATIFSEMHKITNLNILENFWKTFCTLKPCQGLDKNGENKIFYEENEWRYIPERLHIIKKPIVELYLPCNEVTDEKINTINRYLPEYSLIFEPKDIRYIFICDEGERRHVINMIKNIKSPKYPEEQIEILCSKIISYEQIEKDV